MQRAQAVPRPRGRKGALATPSHTAAMPCGLPRPLVVMRRAGASAVYRDFHLGQFGRLNHARDSNLEPWPRCGFGARDAHHALMSSNRHAVQREVNLRGAGKLPSWTALHSVAGDIGTISRSWGWRIKPVSPLARALSETRISALIIGDPF